MKRREFLQSGAGVTLSAVIPVTLAGETQVLVREVRDDVAAPSLRKGHLLVIDESCQEYAGDGVYLYPDWGQPRAYQVDQVASELQFRMPGHEHVLWRQPVSTIFAGRVMEVLDSGLIQQTGLVRRELELPVLPA